MAVFRGGSRKTDLDRARDGEAPPDAGLAIPVAEMRQAPVAADVAIAGPEPAPVPPAPPPPVAEPEEAAEPAPTADTEPETTAADTEPEGPAEPAPAAEAELDTETDLGISGPIGVLFVHGIGNQLAGETLLDWSGPLIRSLIDWIERQETTALVWPWVDRSGRLIDPVVRGQIDFGGSTFPLVKVAVPGLRDAQDQLEHEPQTWVLTEAWWARRIAPPNLSSVADWTGRQGVFGRVVNRIAGRGAIVPKWVAQIGIGTFLSLVSTVVFLGIAALKAVAAILPVGPLKDQVILSQFQGFLLAWWGDIHVIVSSPAQAANIRNTIWQTLDALRSYGCDRIIVVAHSGGTVMSYQVLADPEYAIAGLADPPNAAIPQVTKLITHGEAIGLLRDLPAGILEGDGASARGASSTILSRLDPPLAWSGRWVNFWGSHDPAPLEALPPINGADRPELHEVWNRRSLREDHGGYWENEEEFVLPVLRELDTPSTGPDASRFDAPTAARVGDRYQRVHLLTMWRRVAFVAPFLALAAAVLVPRSGSGFSDLIAMAKSAWTLLPGHDKIDEGLASIRGLLDGVPTDGALILATATLVVLFVGLAVQAVLPARNWSVWPERSFVRWLVGVVDVSPVLVIVAIVLVGITRLPAADVVGGWQRIGATVLLTGLVFAVWVWWTSRRRASGAIGRILTLGALVLLASSIVSVGIAILTDATIRELVIGAALTFALFRPVAGYGASRWSRWDVNERAAVRRGTRRPTRTWITLEAVALLGIAMLTAIGIAIGPIDVPMIGSQHPLLVALGGLVALTVILGLSDAVVAERSTRPTAAP